MEKQDQRLRCRRGKRRRRRREEYEHEDLPEVGSLYDPLGLYTLVAQSVDCHTGLVEIQRLESGESHLAIGLILSSQEYPRLYILLQYKHLH